MPAFRSPSAPDAMMLNLPGATQVIVIFAWHTNVSMRYVLPLTFLVALSMALSCTSSRKGQADRYVYTVDDPPLYDSIVKLDSIFFGYYNTCDVDLDKHASFYADSIEFYHDKGGLMTSKSEVINGTKKFVCGKVRRDLVKGSIEVYPIPGYGAIEMGLHRFFNREEPDAPQRVGRFTIVWQQTSAGWKIRKVISLH